MRRRITFVKHGNEAVDTSQIDVSRDRLHLDNLHAARQEHVTANLYELPQEACNFDNVLQDWKLTAEVVASSQAAA